MLILLALPVIVTVAAMHRYLALYAPTNVLVRRVRAAGAALAHCRRTQCRRGALLAAMHVRRRICVASGAPGWLNFVVLIRMGCDQTGVVAWESSSADCFSRCGVGGRRDQTD